jgi:hypothetical protein
MYGWREKVSAPTESKKQNLVRSIFVQLQQAVKDLYSTQGMTLFSLTMAQQSITMKSLFRFLFCLAISHSSSNLYPLTSATANDNAKVEVDLGAVQETLLIPLIGRAVETKRANGEGLINDPKSVEIVEKLNYDFSHWESSSSVTGAVLRTRLLDQDVQQFLEKHPTGTVVEIGCGLNDRLNRLRLLDGGSKLDDIRWFDLGR